MNSLRLFKLEKYDEIIVNDSLIKNKIKTNDIPNLYNVGIDFSLDANIFYGIKKGDKQYQRIHIEDFDDYDIVLRLVHWSREYQREDYILRVLKTNKDEKIDFEEEENCLNSLLNINIK